MRVQTLVLCCVFVLCVHTRLADAKAEAVRLKGDVILGGLFSIHAKGRSQLQCGRRLNEQVGIHRLEAMLYAVDKVNNDSSLLPGITLGVDLRDDCETENRALEQCLPFIPGALTDEHASCQAPPASLYHPPLAAVVGPAYSNVAVQVASLLRLFYIPQVSYAATSSELSDKDRFEYFVRTVPPDTFQVQAMIDIIRHMKWGAAFAVYSQGSYGEGAMSNFTGRASALGICVPHQQLILSDATRNDFDALFKRFADEPDVNVIVMFCNSDDLRSMLLAAKRWAKAERVARQKWVWLASDFWGTRYRHLEGLEEVADGALTIELQTYEEQLAPFYKHFARLSPYNNSRNPWFREFWESHFNCSLGNDSFTSGVKGQCKVDGNLTRHVRYDAKVPFVIDAVLAIAHALNDMHRNICRGRAGVCPEMNPLDRKLLRSYIRNTTFNGTTGLVRFNADGDSVGRYDVWTFESKTYRRIGIWVDGQLNMSTDFKSGLALSGCGRACPLGEVRRRKREADCCWKCSACGQNEFLNDSYTCAACERGQAPNANYTGCDPLPTKYLGKVWVAVVAAFSAFGVVLTVFICGVFVKYRDTPLIKASGRELSLLLLVALGLCYCVALVLVIRPSSFLCALQRLGLAIGFCTCYATLLVRTNRIARIFHHETVNAPVFISPRSQLLIAAVIIAPELAVVCTVLAIRPPETLLSYEYEDYNLIRCNIDDVALLVIFAYNAVLIVLCTIYAFRTRKTPLNFNEARFIGFCMYTTCVIWISFLPVYYGLGGGYKALALSISAVLSATTILVFIFIPKVYIVLFKPEKNLRSNSRLRSRTLDLSNGVCKNGKAKGSPSQIHRQTPVEVQTEL